jgi:hypothetical protein
MLPTTDIGTNDLENLIFRWDMTSKNENLEGKYII